MKRPHFFLIGAAKSGTTALARYLDQHPAIAISEPKEPNFFLSPDGNARAYEALFHGAAPEVRTGEASGYLHRGPDVVDRVLRARPDALFLAVLRNPVERAFSHWQFSRQLGIEHEPDFLRAVTAPSTQRHRDYFEIGLYSKHLSVWLDRISLDRIQIHVSEDLRTDALAVCRATFAHIGVDTSFRPDTSERHNSSRLPRIQWLHELMDTPPRFVRRGARALVPSQSLRAKLGRGAFRVNSRKSSISHQARTTLVNAYGEDIRSLESLLGRDLSAWTDLA